MNFAVRGLLLVTMEKTRQGIYAKGHGVGVYNLKKLLNIDNQDDRVEIAVTLGNTVRLDVADEFIRNGVNF